MNRKSYFHSSVLQAFILNYWHSITTNNSCDVFEFVQNIIVPDKNQPSCLRFLSKNNSVFQHNCVALLFAIFCQHGRSATKQTCQKQTYKKHFTHFLFLQK